MLHKRFFWIFAISLLFTSCKKDNQLGNDGVSINWEISSPTSESDFQLPSLIPVKGIISAENSIELITIQLNHSSVGKVGDAVIMNPGKVRFELDTFLNISDQSLLSGDYYLSFNARTANGSQEYFISIFISEVPLKLESTYVISRNDIIYINNGGVLEDYLDARSVVDLAFIQSPKNIAFLIDTSISEIKAVDLTTKSQSWIKGKSQFSAKPILSHIHFNNGELFFSDESGKILGINESNQAVYSSQSKSGYLAERILKTVNRVVSSQKAVFSTQYVFSTFYYPSGSYMNENNTVGKVDYLFNGVGQKVTIIRNAGNGSEIKQFDTDNNNFDFGEVRFTERIAEAIQINKEELAVISGQSLYKVNIASNSKIKLGEVHSGKSKIVYEKLAGTIWEFNEKSAYIFSINNQNQSPTEQLFSENIKHILFLYNR